MDATVLKQSVPEKSVVPKSLKKKIDESKNVKNNGNRFLITINFLGSAGPIRFLANQGDSVSEVIDAALKLYGREKRLPHLGSDVNTFILYPANAGLAALNPSDLIGSQGVRNFILCKNERATESRADINTRKRGNGLKAWLNKSLTFKISSH